MGGFRRRRRNRENSENLFKRKMEDIERQEEEQRLNRRQCAMTKISNGIISPGERDIQSASSRIKKGGESCEIGKTVSKSSFARKPEDYVQSNRTANESSSSRRSEIIAPRNYDRNLNHRKSTGPQSVDGIVEGFQDSPTLNRKSKRHKILSPVSRCANATLSSPTRSKEVHAIRLENKMKDENDDTSIADIEDPATPSSVSYPSRHGFISSQKSNRSLNCATNSDDKKICGLKIFSPLPKPTMVTLGGSQPRNTATLCDSDNQSDSDGSFNMLSRFKKKKNQLKKQKVEQGTIKSEQSNGSTKGNKSRKDSSLTLSDADDEEDQTDQREKFRLQKTKKDENISRRRRYADDDSVENGQREIFRRQKQDFLKGMVTLQGNDSDNSDSDESAHKQDNDESRSPFAQYTKNVQRKHFFPVTGGRKINNLERTSTTAVDDAADDGFMSDCDPILAQSSETLGKIDTSRRCKKEHLCLRKRSRKGRERTEQENESFVAVNQDDNQCEKDRGDAKSDLHPNFANPKFGPYEPIEPLILNKNQNESIIQVPASLSRFLAPFQKEGIRFMYGCLARKSGVILGDEMGCGKTVQVIALLCALFHKTGTRKDMIDIQQRRSLVQDHVLKMRKLKDQALSLGDVVEENIEEWRTSLSLSPWNPVMIIVPPTILDTWKNAFKTFSHFSVSFYSSKTKVDAIRNVLYGSTDIMVVPKSVFQEERHIKELERVKWKLIVIDEFHNFKNFKAKISIHLRKLKELHHPLILGMTGTPMQNNHTELWNLVDLVETNFFGSRDDFKANIDRPITLGRHKCADPRAKARSEAASSELRKGLDKIYIKREKKDVLKGQLPEKNEEFILCDLSPLQKKVYRHVIKLPDFDLVRHGSRPCDCGINQNFFRKLLKLKSKAEQLEYMRTNKASIMNQSKCCKRIPVNPRHEKEGEPFIDPDAAIWRTLDAHCSDGNAAEEGCERCPWCCALPCLTKLNKLSSHLGLLQASKTDDAIGSPAYITYKKEREFAKVALAGVVGQLPGGGYDRSDGIMDDHFSLSGKLKVLNSILKKFYSEGAKVLLFSHSTQSLDLIENWLKSRGSFEYRRMDGSTPLSRRQHLTDEFNNADHIFLFLLSIKATGLGLNLTSANRVIMFDVSWNPSWEIQAQDRAHRIGQKRDVCVVRLISKGTVEEMIYLRQIYKEHLKQDTLEDHDDLKAVAPRVFRGVQGDKYRKGEIFGTENLFRLKENGSFLYEIWAESRNRGDDSSCLEIHDSGKVSQVLLDMTDEEKKKAADEDDLAILQALSLEDVSGRSKESPHSFGHQFRKRCSLDELESDVTIEGKATEKSVEKNVRAGNHRDLFRSDRGGAALNTGEDGFDEEMGGQTQAAFEIYENVKDNLCEEEDSDSNSNCNIVDDHDEDTSQFELPTLQVKSEIWKNADENQNVHRKDSTTASRPTCALTKSDTKKDGKDLAPRATVQVQRSSNFSENGSTSANNPESNIEQKLEIEPTTTLRMNRPSESIDPQNSVRKESHGNAVRNSTQTKSKILLVGCVNVNAAKTEFSAADLRRPMYRRKKKKKRG